MNEIIQIYLIRSFGSILFFFVVTSSTLCKFDKLFFLLYSVEPKPKFETEIMVHTTLVGGQYGL